MLFAFSMIAVMNTNEGFPESLHPEQFLTRFRRTEAGGAEGDKEADIKMLVELASHFLAPVVTRGIVYREINRRTHFMKVASREDLVCMVLVWEGSHSMWTEMRRAFPGRLDVRQKEVPSHPPLHNYLSRPDTTARLGEIRHRVHCILADDEGKKIANDEWQLHLEAMNRRRSALSNAGDAVHDDLPTPMFQLDFLE